MDLIDDTSSTATDDSSSSTLSWGPMDDEHADSTAMALTDDSALMSLNPRDFLSSSLSLTAEDQATLFYAKQLPKMDIRGFIVTNEEKFREVPGEDRYVAAEDEIRHHSQLDIHSETFLYTLNDIIFEQNTSIELDSTCCAIHNWDTEKHTFRRDDHAGSSLTPKKSIATSTGEEVFPTPTDLEQPHTTSLPATFFVNNLGEEIYCVRGDQDANHFTMPSLRDLQLVESDQNASFVVKNCKDSIQIFTEHLHFVIMKRCKAHIHRLFRYAVALYDKHLHNESFPLFKLLVDENHEDAFYYLAVMLDSGRGCKKDPASAKTLCARTFAALKVRAENGDSTAFLNYARLYDFGFGTGVDLKMAAEWYQRSIDAANCKISMYNLSNMYSNGEGVPKDTEKSFELALRASYLGYADAQYHCGNMLKGDEKGDEAVHWYKEAIKSGSLSAVNALASMYYEGKLVQKNLNMAIRLWKIAVEKGNSPSCYNCAYRYLDGVGLSQDYCNALRLFRVNVCREEKRRQTLDYMMQLHASATAASHQTASEETTVQSQHLLDVLLQLIKSQRREYLTNGTLPRNRRGKVAYYQLANDFFHGFGGPQDIDEALKLLECAAVHQKRKKALLHLLQIHYCVDTNTVHHTNLRKAKFYLQILRDAHYRPETLLMIWNEISFFEGMYNKSKEEIWTDVEVITQYSDD